MLELATANLGEQLAEVTRRQEELTRERKRLLEEHTRVVGKLKRTPDAAATKLEAAMAEWRSTS